ncbi:MAG TPA: hypothetical protein VKA46_33775 [Gemmataceae bacterium]|nr:hypothetical protein [Gemmataceae bacterium]
MSPFPRRLRLAVAALLFVLAAGCVEFEKQTVFVVFPKDRDEAHVLLVYEGIHVDSDKEDDLKSAKEQLSGFAGEQQFCLWAWPFHVDLTPDKRDADDQKKVKDLFRKHLTIKNGAFYTRADGKLCAYQHITVREVSKLVASANGMISEGLLADEQGPSMALDKESQAMVLRAARDKHAWLKLEPGRLSATVPMTPASARRLKRGVLGVDDLAEVLQALGADKPKPVAPGKPREPRVVVEQLHARASLWADNPWSFEQRHDRVTVSLGVGDGEPLRLELPARPHAATTVDAALAEHARTLKVKFRKDVTVESLIEEFAKEHGGTKRPEK